MLRVGFLDQIVEPERLNAVVDDLATRIASCAPQAIAGMKRALNDLARDALDDQAAEAAFCASLRSDEFANALQAWSQRRSS
jgi:enoyl-CoA hydratase/carnithine racemase